METELNIFFSHADETVFRGILWLRDFELVIAPFENLMTAVDPEKICMLRPVLS